MTGHRIRQLLSLLAVVSVAITLTTGCAVKLIDRIERASPGTYQEMQPVCSALRKVEPFRSLLGDAQPLPGGDLGNCEWSPTDTPGQVSLKVQTVLHQGPVIENVATHRKRLVTENTCDEQCPPESGGTRQLTEISVSQPKGNGWFGCGQATNPRAVRLFGFMQHANVAVAVTMQTRWRVPAKQLPALVTDPAGPLRVAFQTSYLAYTYRVDLPNPAPLRPPVKNSACKR